MLQIGPRCSKYFKDSTGGVRNQDIQANYIRSDVINKESLSPLDLNLKLGTKVAVSISPNIDVERCIDLFARTNQFNMTLSRSKIDSIQRTNGNLNLISCEASDHYSNSGIVSAASFEIKGNVLEFNEFVISCRVLGRELETVLLSGMIDRIMSEAIDRIDCVDINYNLGPRNDPAIQWLCKLANSTVEKLPVDKVCIEMDRLESARKVFNRLAR
jgi:FkbH-like protein